MMNNYIADAVITAIYNVILLAGTAYLVLAHDWSGWWFALTVCCLGTWRMPDPNKKNPFEESEDEKIIVPPNMKKKTDE